MKERIIIAVACFAVGFILSKSCTDAKVEYKIQTDTVTNETVRDSLVFVHLEGKTDTIFLPKYIIKEAPIKEGEDSVSVYMDTVLFETDFEMHYRINVTGRINNMNFSYSDERPEIFKIVEREKIVTTTKTIQPSGFYALAGLRSDKTFSFGAAYLKKKWQYQYSITPDNLGAVHEFKLGYKIF
jgi:hypothetical protein